MPSRRRHRSEPSAAPVAARPATGGAANDPMEAAARFAAAVKETEKRDKAERERKATAKAEAERKAAEAAAHADALKAAQRELERAIAGVRSAKAAGRGTVDADARWKAAKATLIELETGVRPAWAPKPPEATAADEQAGDAAADDAAADVDAAADGDGAGLTAD